MKTRALTITVLLLLLIAPALPAATAAPPSPVTFTFCTTRLPRQLEPSAATLAWRAWLTR